MIKEDLTVGDKLFSTLYGDVEISSLVPPYIGELQSTTVIDNKAQKNRVKVMLKDIWDTNIRYHTFLGYSSNSSVKLQTLFKDKESAIEYLKNYKG